MLLKFAKSFFGLFLFLLFSIHPLQAQTRYIDSIFQEVKKATYEYANKDGESLKLDLYEPVGDKENNRPAIIWMHGGGFAVGARDGGMEKRFMEVAAKSGYVGVSISYRLTAKGKGFSCDASRKDKMETFRKASWDLWDAIAYIHKNSAPLGVDPDKIIVGGSSAGAEGALNAIYMRDWLYEDSSYYNQIQPLALYSCAGAIIDARYINEKNAIPAVLFHGTDDNLVPYATAPHHYCDANTSGYIWLDGSKTIAEKLKLYNSSYLFYTYEKARHEIAGIQFDKLPEIFAFFKGLIDQAPLTQIAKTIPKK